jgi:hypothetical protein
MENPSFKANTGHYPQARARHLVSSIPKVVLHGDMPSPGLLHTTLTIESRFELHVIPLQLTHNKVLFLKERKHNSQKKQNSFLKSCISLNRNAFFSEIPECIKVRSRK